MKRYRISLADRTFDVKVLDDPRGQEVRVQVNGVSFTVAVQAVPPEKRATDESAPSPPPGRASVDLAPSAGMVIAPLPGVVKAITVRDGQKVAANEELVVIEAMKMDNVIRAPRAGTVGTVLVSEGRQVAYGDPLVKYRD